ncbi:hypothetical protein ACP70R_008186 [Stipagrostis hirtigluma subsp. patula]
MDSKENLAFHRRGEISASSQIDISQSEDEGQRPNCDEAGTKANKIVINRGFPDLKRNQMDRYK